MPDYHPLDPATSSLWGKSSRKDSTSLALWRHLDDASEVALLLWRDWLPRAIRRRIAACLPGGEADARILLCWLAGVHDIGIATPAFTSQVSALADRVRATGLSWRPEAETDRRHAPHATAGQVILDDWLARNFAWETTESRQFSAVVGSHHGVPPNAQTLSEVRERAYLLGWTGASGSAWRDVQRGLLDRMAARTGAAERIPDWHGVRLHNPCRSW